MAPWQDRRFRDQRHARRSSPRCSPGSGPSPFHLQPDGVGRDASATSPSDSNKALTRTRTASTTRRSSRSRALTPWVAATLVRSRLPYSTSIYSKFCSPARPLRLRRPLDLLPRDLLEPVLRPPPRGAVAVAQVEGPGPVRGQEDKVAHDAAVSRGVAPVGGLVRFGSFR